MASAAEVSVAIARSATAGLMWREGRHDKYCACTYPCIHVLGVSNRYQNRRMNKLKKKNRLT